jgi:hypothetical protein
MTAIPNPVDNVLSKVEPSEVDQPAPADPPRGQPEDLLPTENRCQICGCQWVTVRDDVRPKGTSECGFCGCWRGQLHRNASLDEFGGSSTATRNPDSTVEYQFASGGPTLDWSELRQFSRAVVLEQPQRSYVDELVAMGGKSAYEQHLYLKDIQQTSG